MLEFSIQNGQFAFWQFMRSFGRAARRGAR